MNTPPDLLAAIVDALADEPRATAWAVDDLGPSCVMLDLSGDPLRTVYLAVGFNRDGWEAALDIDGRQTGLPDGPAATASNDVVAGWVRTVLDGLVTL